VEGCETELALRHKALEIFLMRRAGKAHVSIEEAIAQVMARMVKLAHDLARTKVHDDYD
jgi:hypothetical protein